MKLTFNQKELLNALLDKYENSKTYEGTNLVLQNFAVAPIVIWPEYVSDYANIEQIKDFEAEMLYLQDTGLIDIRKKDGVIKKLVACNAKLVEYYDLLQRKQKSNIFDEQNAFFEQWKKQGNNLRGH